MKPRSSTRPRAQRDVQAEFRHLARQAGLIIANRFHESFQDEIAGLLEHPEKGTRVSIHGSRLGDLRRWHVSGFERTLIFYCPTEYGIEVVRVLHGAQDIPRLLRLER